MQSMTLGIKQVIVPLTQVAVVKLKKRSGARRILPTEGFENRLLKSCIYFTTGYQLTTKAFIMHVTESL
jgi:hypothetical protein